jgi:hypothetical protein
VIREPGEILHWINILEGGRSCCLGGLLRGAADWYRVSLLLCTSGGLRIHCHIALRYLITAVSNDGLRAGAERDLVPTDVPSTHLLRLGRWNNGNIITPGLCWLVWSL